MWLSLGLAGSVAKKDQGGQWKPSLPEAGLPEGDPHPGRGHSGLYMWRWVLTGSFITQEKRSLEPETNDTWQSVTCKEGASALNTLYSLDYVSFHHVTKFLYVWWHGRKEIVFIVTPISQPNPATSSGASDVLVSPGLDGSVLPVSCVINSPSRCTLWNKCHHCKSKTSR